jgi:putative colanic acid biosynthesis acetyltransferase WcaF
MMTTPAERITVLKQDGAYASAWSTGALVRMALWRIVYAALFRPSPKFLKSWRLMLLKLFGATIHGTPYVANSARVRMPWHLTMHHRACLGEFSECYNLGPVELKARCTIAQHVYLCAGTHDITTLDLPLAVGPIVIGEDVFVGARAFVMPGVVVGDGAVVGACAVVTRDVEPWTIVAGNPAKAIKKRVLADKPADGSAET